MDTTVVRQLFLMVQNSYPIFMHALDALYTVPNMFGFHLLC